jgi:bifunctional non-homologous end joining protein LigD
MVAFDLLYLNGHDLRKLRLVERKRLLKKLVDKTDIQFSEGFDVDGPEMFKHACKTGLEGVVSKVRDSQYPGGRTNHWVKVSARRWQSQASQATNGMDCMSAGARASTWSTPAKVDLGFDRESAKALRARLTPLIRETQPYSKHRPPRHLGRAQDSRRDRISGEVSRRQGAASVL